MSDNPSIREIYEKYQSSERTLIDEIESVEAQLDELREKLAEARSLRAAAETLLEAGDGAPDTDGGKTKSAKSSTTRKKSSSSKKKTSKRAPRKSAKSKPAEASKKESDSSTDSRRGRRKVKESKDFERIRDLGIVDAAIELAELHGVEKTDAGQVLSWFEEIGYEGRKGTPSRNSVYVSLNREVSQGEKKGHKRITRPDRGVFQFHFENC